MAQDKKPLIRQPKQQRSIETRSKILDAGEKLFVSRGYHDTSSKRIAREAGVAIGSFYNYFPDKKALLFELHQRHMLVVHDLVLDVLAEGRDDDDDPDGRAVIERLIDQAFAAHTHTPELHRVIESMRYSDDDFEQLSIAERKRQTTRLVELLKSYGDELRVDDIEAAAHVVSGAVEDAIHSLKMFGSSLEEDRIKNALVEMIFRYLYK